MLIRTFTKSEFDHVAMIIRTSGDPDEVYLVEAVGNKGVSYNKWSNIRNHIGTGKFYAKLSYRRTKSDHDLTYNLGRFLDEAVGKKYSIGGTKLLQQKTLRISKSTVNDKGPASPKANGDKLVEDDRTFFCSELIAKAYKVLGFIEDDETSCAQFYPNPFSEKGDSFLKLMDDVEIGPEMQIIIDADEENDDLDVLSEKHY